MNPLAFELLCRLPFQLNDQLLNVHAGLPHHQMHMIRKNRARPHRQPRPPNVSRKPPPHRPRLQPIKIHWRIFQATLRRFAQSHIMLIARQRPSFKSLRRRPKPKQLPGPHKLRPTPPRIIGQPKPIRAENNMITNDHTRSPPFPWLAATQSGALCDRRPNTSLPILFKSTFCAHLIT